jgi:hypothetical protein
MNFILIKKQNPISIVRRNHNTTTQPDPHHRLLLDAASKRLKITDIEDWYKVPHKVFKSN